MSVAALALPFLAQLKKQVPDASFVDDTSGSGSEAAWRPDNRGFDAGAGAAPPGPIAQQPVSQLPNMATPAPQASDVPEDKGNIFRQPYESKGHALLRILQQGLVGGLSGLSQNASTYAATGRNAGFGGGVGAGFTQTLPFLKATQQAELGQKQAQVGDIQSQIALREAQAKMMGQSIPITLPNGQQVYVPASQAGHPLASAISGGYGLTKAQMDNQTKLAVANIQSGRLGHLVPGMNPDTGQPGMQMLDRTGQSLGWVDHSVVPSLMSRTSSTIEWKEGDDGAFHALPKSTVSRPNLPSASAVSNPQPSAGSTLPFLPPSQPASNSAAPPPPRPAITGNVARPQRPAPNAAGTPPARPAGGVFFGKSAADQGVVYDPQTNERSWMTRKEAFQKGLDFTAGGKNAAKTMEDDRVLNVRLGDIEQKTQLYSDTMKTPLNLKDTADLNVALAAAEKALVTPGLLSKLPANEGAANILDEVAKNYNLNDMSAATYKRLQAYVNMREAMLGYTAALTKSGKSSDKNLELNLDVVPKPVIEPSKAAEALDQFRQNLDIVEQGVPRVKGVKAPKEWRGGSGGNQQGGPPAGARVRDYSALQPGR